MIGVSHYLVLSAVMVVLGLMVVLTKRNAVAILVGVEFILNCANLNLVAFSRYGGVLQGQAAAPFVIVLAAAEAAVALAIFLNFYHTLATIDVDRGKELKG